MKRWKKIKMMKSYLKVVFLVYCNIVSNDYEQHSKVLFTFVPNKSLDQLPEISPKIIMLLNTFILELSFFSVWFVDPNSKLPEIEDKVNLTFQPRDWIYDRG